MPRMRRFTVAGIFEAHRDQPQRTGTADIRQETLIAALLNAGARREARHGFHRRR